MTVTITESVFDGHSYYDAVCDTCPARTQVHNRYSADEWKTRHEAECPKPGRDLAKALGLPVEPPAHARRTPYRCALFHPTTREPLSQREVDDLVEAGWARRVPDVADHTDFVAAALAKAGA